MFYRRARTALRQISWPIVVVLLLALAVGGIAFLSFRLESQALETQALATLRTVSHLKADAVDRSISAERARVLVLSRAPIFVDFLTNAKNASDRARVTGFAEQTRAAANLDNVMVFDDASRLAVAAREDGADEPEWREAAQRAIDSGQIVFVDFHRGSSDGRVDLGYAAPVIISDAAGRRTVGAVVLDLSASRILGPDFAVWPAASATGGVALLRRDGSDLLQIGDFNRDGEVDLRRLPVVRSIASSRIISGETEPFRGISRSGVEVLMGAAPLALPGWVVSVRIDRDEALKEARRLGVALGGLTLAAFVAALVFVFFLEQRRRLRATLAVMERQRAVQAAEQQFRAIFEQAAVGIAIMAPSGRFLRVNSRLCQMLGYSEEALLGLSVLDITPADDASRGVLKHLGQNDANPTALEKRYIRADGTVLWGALSVRVVSKADGTPDYFIATIADVTERVHAQQSLQDSETRFRLVVEAAPNAIVMTDSSGSIELVNRQAETLFGYSRHELVGRPLEILVPDRYRAAHEALRETFVRAPEARLTDGREISAWRKDGSEVPVEIGLTPIEIDEGTKILATIVDITERKRQAEALQKSEDQLRQAQKMEAIGNLTGGMAHDFNNLLAVIIGNLDLARRTIDAGSDLQELVGEAMDAAFRGADLTQRLLAFARRQPLRPRQVVLKELMGGVTKLLSRTLGENIEIALDVPADLWPVIVDPAQLESVLINLANNARDAMPRGGSLKFAAANRALDADYASLHPGMTPGRYVMIEVSDSGTGMSADVVAHIFEPFYTTKEVGKGTGLGLSMVYGFIKQSGGYVSVYSEPDVGTTFRLFLPVVAAEAVTPAASEPAASQEANGETVLVVEDNEALRRLTMRQLAELGYRVVVATNASEALQRLGNDRIDLLFTDIVMPGEMDGFALAQHVLTEHPNVTVVLTSGFPDAKINGNLGDKARLRLLTKPYHREDLARILRDALAS